MDQHKEKDPKFQVSPNMLGLMYKKIGGQTLSTHGRQLRKKCVVGIVKLERTIGRLRHRWKNRIKLEVEKLDEID